jgi:hypothetical protein
MDGKLTKITNKQIVRPNTTNNFYPLFIIEMDIVVSIEEISILKKALNIIYTINIKSGLES